MPQTSLSGERFAERIVQGRDDRGEDEQVTIWVDYCDGGVWRVGRAVNLHLREHAGARREDIVFEGFELMDALERANDCLDEDLEASADVDDHNDEVEAITEDELKRGLEHWFVTQGLR